METNPLLAQVHFPSGIKIVKSIIFKAIDKEDAFARTLHLGPQLFVDIRKLVETEDRLLDGKTF